MSKIVLPQKNSKYFRPVFLSRDDICKYLSKLGKLDLAVGEHTS